MHWYDVKYVRVGETQEREEGRQLWQDNTGQDRTGVVWRMMVTVCYTCCHQVVWQKLTQVAASPVSGLIICSVSKLLHQVQLGGGVVSGVVSLVYCMGPAVSHGPCHQHSHELISLILFLMVLFSNTMAPLFRYPELGSSWLCNRKSAVLSVGRWDVFEHQKNIVVNSALFSNVVTKTWFETWMYCLPFWHGYGHISFKLLALP